MQKAFVFLTLYLTCHFVIFSETSFARSARIKKSIDQDFLIYYVAVLNSSIPDEKLAEVVFADELTAYSPDEIISFQGHFKNQIKERMQILKDSSIEALEFEQGRSKTFDDRVVPFYVLIARYKQYSYQIVVDKGFPIEKLISLIESCEQQDWIDSRTLASIMGKMRVYNPRRECADRTLETIEQTVHEAKEAVSDAVVALMLRGEKLQIVKGKTIELDAQAYKFAKEARKVRKNVIYNKIQQLSCCCFVTAVIGGAAATAILLV